MPEPRKLFFCTVCRKTPQPHEVSMRGLFWVTGATKLPVKCPTCGEEDNIFPFPIIECAHCKCQIAVADGRTFADYSLDVFPPEIEQECGGKERIFRTIDPTGTAWDPGP